MTPEQNGIIVKMFQMGMACGLGHPFEFFSNYIRSLCHVPYTKIPELEEKAYDAMLAFMSGCAGCPEEEDFYNKLTATTLNDLMNKWYRRPKPGM